MIINLTPKEIINLKIVYKGKRDLSPEYIKDRDAYWDTIVEEGKKAGKAFWNGELYTFERFIQYDQTTPILELGSCEYKDRLFKKKIGFQEIEKIYGKNHLHIHCGVNCFPITTDNKLVIGVKKTTLDLRSNVYAFISGNLNKDEQEVVCFSDIKSFAKKEVEEESGIKVDLSRLKFHQINHFNTYFNFEFVYYLDIHSKDIASINRDDEFLNFICMTPQEIIDTKEPLFSDLEYSRNYISGILERSSHLDI